MARLLALALLLLASSARAVTIVSLGFDDNTSSHTAAANILSARGIRATFYVNTGRVGLPGFLTLSEVNAIAAQGHEIAGHTINHLDVTTLSAAQRQQQICDDRAQLQTWGFNPVSFAYPFGAFNSAAQTTAQSCGYTNARTVGGLTCSGCPAAETNPPADEFAIRTPASVTSATTLAQMQGWVMAAENSGGGIVPIVMHHVCAGCSDLAISPATLTAFADWLNTRGPNTVARTMREALGAPPPPPPPASTTTASLWTTEAPAVNEYSTESVGLNLGTRFRSSAPGQITALKYYKPGPVGNGPKQGRLWNAATGALLGSVSFPATTTQGWHTVDLPAPVSIQAGVDYIVSYHTNSGYSTTRNYFGSPRLSPPLTGVQGHYLYSAAVAMPTSTTGNSNYWADVVWRSTGTTAPPPASTSCFTSNGTFQNRTFPAQTGTFSARFEATPGDGSIDGLAGFSNGAADAVTDLASIMRFNLQGLIDARNGGAYTSVSSVPYVGGQPYKFRLEVNVPARTYSAFVTTGFNPETQIANNYAFRSEQSGVTQLTNLGLVSTSGSETVCHLSVTPTTPPGPSPLASIAVTPVSASIPQGGFQEFRAVGTRVNGSTVALNNHWSIGPSLPVAKRDGMLVAYEDKVFAFGGQNASGALASAHFFQVGSSGPWVTLAPMPAPRYEASAVMPNSVEDIWILGGFNEFGNPTDTLQIYSNQSNTWSVAAQGLPTASACSIADSSGPDIVLLTGCDGSGNNARRLDHVDLEGVWRRRADAPHPHANGVGFYNGRVFYVVGGQSSDGMHPQLDRWEQATNTWTTISTMPVALTEMEGAVVDGKWYIYGGRENGVTPSSRTWVYDFGTNSWSPGPSAPFARFRALGGGGKEGSRQLLVVGGHSGSGETADFQIFDPTPSGVTWSASVPAIATVSAAGVATGLSSGSTQITASSSGVSGSATLTVVNPVPVLTEVSPRSVRPGSASFTLTVRGSGFLPSSTVRWNGSNRTTTFVSGSTLTATIPTSDVAAIAVASVTVFTPAPGGGTSGVGRFLVTNWLATAPLPRGRGGASAVRLDNGQVLVAGTGEETDERTASLPGDLFSPATNGWSSTADSESVPTFHAGVRLADGRVLLAGGWETIGCCVRSAVVYEPSTQQFSLTGGMSNQKAGRNAVLLNDGRVLYAPGEWPDDGGDDSVELYNAAGGTWTLTAPMLTRRRFGALVKLADGRVMMTGGTNEVALTATEIWNPATGLWTSAAPMGTAREQHSATLLLDGRVLVAGGGESRGGATTELYNPATNSWTPGPSMSQTRPLHTATLRPDGTVLVAGSGTSQIYDPSSNSWSAPEPMLESRVNHAAALLADGRVFTVAGYGSAVVAEVYSAFPSTVPPNPTPSIASISPASALPGSPGFTLTVSGTNFLPGSTVRWNGGNRTTTFVSASTLTATIPTSDIAAVGVASVTVFNPAPGGGTSNVAAFSVTNWAPTGSMTAAYAQPEATLLADGRVLVTATVDGENPSPGNLYNPATGSWLETPGTTSPRYNHGAVRLPDGRVLIAGGSVVGECCLDSAAVFDPATNQFSPTGDMTAALGGEAMFTLNDGRVIYVGNDSSEDPFGSEHASIYNVAAGTWSAVTPRSISRRGAAIAKLNDGRVLVAGGQTNSGGTVVATPSAEVWSPATGLWSPIASMPQARIGASATTLQDGRVFVVGGSTVVSFVDPPQLATTLLYGPASNSWSAGPTMSRARLAHTATLRPDGTVLVAGAGDSQIFDPAANAWRAPEAMNDPRVGHEAVLLGNNRVLAVGPGASAEVYTVAVSSSGTTPPPAVSSTCVTSLNNFQNISMPAETGAFTARFDATPGDGSIDGVAGFSNGAADGYGDLGPIVRFNLGGTIDARNGGAYTAVAPVPYQGGVVHRFRLEVNVATRRYSAFVSTGTAPERAIAVNYAFRNEQSAVTQLTNLGVASTNGSETVCLYSSSTVTPPPPTPNPAPVVGSVSPSSATAGSGALTLTIDGSGFVSGSVARWNGSNRATTFVSASRVTAAIPSSDLASPTTATVTVFNPAPGGGTSNGASFVVHAAPPPPPPPPASTACVTGGGFQNMPFAAQTGAFTAQFEATPSDGSIDGATGFSNGAIDSYGDLGPIVRFNLGGTIDARNGGSYQAVTPVPYTGGVVHRFRLEVDVPTRRYSAFVAVGSGPEQQIANNYAFRNEQASVTQLNNLGLGATGGTETVCSLSVTPSGGALSAMSATSDAEASGPSLLSCPTCPSPVVDLEQRRAYPNPWRADQHSGLPMVFDRMPAGTVIEIYSVSGKPLKTITAAGGSASWDLSFEGGEKASSGYYLYRATTPAGVKKSGTIAIVR